MFDESLPRDPIDHVGKQPALGRAWPEGTDDQQGQIGGGRQPSDELQAFGVRPMQVFSDQNARATVEQVAHQIDSRAQGLLGSDCDVRAGVTAQDRDDRPEQHPQCFLRVGQLRRNRGPRPDPPFDRFVQQVERSAQRPGLGVGREYLVIGQGGDELAHQPALSDAGFAIKQDDAWLGQPLRHGLQAA